MTSESVSVAPENNWQRYRTRPVEVDALQFDPNGAHMHRLPEGVTGIPSPGADNWNYEGCKFFVVVQSGKHLYRTEIKPLDWIVRSDDGSWRVCNREVFEHGFEPKNPVTKRRPTGLFLPQSAR